MNRLALAAFGMYGVGPGGPELIRAVAGKLVIVTGASRGIGAAVAGRLALAGARVILLARGEVELHALSSRIRARGGEASYLPLDLRDTDAAHAAALAILEEFGTPDIVISNAGLSIHRYLDEYSERFHDVTRTMATNYLGPVALLLPLLAAMRARGSGQLISVSTTSVALPAPGWSTYGASKSAFEAWLRAVAPELAVDGVAVTSIRFPLVHTAMSAPTYAGLPGMSARGAARTICRAIVRRPRLIAPWWVRLGGLGMELAPGLSDRVMRVYARVDRSR